MVSYSYFTQTGYGNLMVILDGASVASSGAITMNGNPNLNITAGIDVRGKWISNFYAGFKIIWMSLLVAIFFLVLPRVEIRISDKWNLETWKIV